jgi:N-dimethylarginine dimethylaminohydrolase
MDPQSWVGAERDLSEAAHRQWSALHAALLDKGASVEFVDPKPGLPDLVFTANAAIVLDGKALLSRFRHPERKGEEPVFAAAFGTLHPEIESVAELPESMILEGAGDCIWDQPRSQFWMGCGPRSDRLAAQFVTDQFGVDCIPLELTDPSFYHLDTAFCALTSGDVIYYPQAFAPAARHAIEERVAPEQRIALERDDAMTFAANTVPLDHSLLMSSCTDRLRHRLEERGYTVVATPLHAFLRSGGSACCLTLRLDHRSQGARDQAIDRTTPPSTLRAAPVVALAPSPHR